jgi:hypothetical protein
MQFHTVLTSSVPSGRCKHLTCSVPWVQFCLPVIRWSGDNVRNTSWFWIVYYLRIHCTHLELLFKAYYFYMDNKVSKVKGLSKTRFNSIIFLLRLAGIPFKMKKMSTIYAIYMITMISCTCITFLAMFVDVYIYRDDLGHVMTNIRDSIAITNVVWMFLYCR